MFDFSFQNILHSNLINFTIMIAIIVWILAKLNLAEKTEQLKTSIINRVTTSDEVKNKADKFLKDTQKSVENLPQELAAIKDSALKSADNLADKIIQDAHSQIDKLEKNTQKNISNQISKIQSELKEEVSELSLNIAKDKIKQKLASDKELHKKLINESIDKLDKVEF